MIYQELVNKEKSLCVVGLGYVGLPIALEFAKSF
jgi:UDP-N-acetyl-D-galactosamine dehydrogenase